MVSIKEQLELVSELIINANLEIKKHNDIVINFNTEKRNLITSIWKFITDEFNADITKFNTDFLGLTNGITALKTQVTNKLAEYKVLDLDIKNLSKNVTSIQPTINEINRLLKKSK